MGYKEALVAAGAEVHNFKEFGSYQGDWWARVTFGGKEGWVKGAYGSCTGCDAFEAEFGYSEYQGCREHSYAYEDSCASCLRGKADWLERLVKFGASYLDHLKTQEEAEGIAAENLSWDMEASDMLNFLRANAIQGQKGYDVPSKEVRCIEAALRHLRYALSSDETDEIKDYVRWAVQDLTLVTNADEEEEE